MEHLVNYAYSGRVQIDTDNVQSLLVGANFLNLYEVKDYCCDFLIRKYEGSFWVLYM